MNGKSPTFFDMVPLNSYQALQEIDSLIVSIGGPYIYSPTIFSVSGTLYHVCASHANLGEADLN